MRELPIGLVLGALIVAGCNTSPTPSAAAPVAAAPTTTSSRATIVPPAAAPPPASLLRDHEIPWDDTPVLRTLGRIAAEVSETEYVHGIAVDARRGIYRFDCSGMAAWVLSRGAPHAHAQTTWRREGRPLAQTYEAVIRAASPDARTGWRRVLRVGDARPGDVVAWRKPENLASQNTGHVAFVVLPPLPLPDDPQAYLVRIVDATSLHHLNDVRAPPGETGFGYGTIALVVDSADRPIAYGWVGPRGPVFTTSIAIGRPLS